MLWHFEIFVNPGQSGLEISKRYFSYSFHPMSPKLHEDVAYRRENQATTFLVNPPSLKKFVGI